MKTKDLHTAFKNKGYVNFSIDQFFLNLLFFQIILIQLMTVSGLIL